MRGLCWVLAIFAACEAITKGSLDEIVIRDDPPQEVAAAVFVYGGGIAVAVNRRCRSPNLIDPEVLCEKASVLRLDKTGSVRWVYTLREANVRITSLSEVSPGRLALSAITSVGGDMFGFVEAIEDGAKVWRFEEVGTLSRLQSLVATNEGLWAAGAAGEFGTVVLIDGDTGTKKWGWLLAKTEDPPEQRVEESMVNLLLQAPEKGVFAVGTVKRVGKARNFWVARFRGAVQTARADEFEGKLGSAGYDDQPGSAVLLSDGLVVVALDPNPDNATLTLWKFGIEDIAAGPEAVLQLAGDKYRLVGGISDGEGGAILAGGWRPGKQGAFEPCVLKLFGDGNPDPTWQSEIGWGKRPKRVEGMAGFAAMGYGSPYIGGWFVEAEKVVGFLAKVE